jgi:hypothetical protein
MMRDLLFLNPALKAGLNLTVRNGSKWADVTPGEVLVVKRTEVLDLPITQVVVIAANVINTQDTPIDSAGFGWLIDMFEHDESCGDITGLRAAMNAAYGQGGWGPEVTLLWFWNDGPAIQ